jgi:8-oxo-dGTP pyrophosphatase MutT (NUDIX family)
VAARRELAEEIGLTASALLPAGSICTIWDGRRDRIHFFELHLVALPKLQLDNREVIEARLNSPIELQNTVPTGLVASYLARRRSLGCHP